MGVLVSQITTFNVGLLGKTLATISAGNPCAILTEIDFDENPGWKSKQKSWWKFWRGPWRESWWEIPAEVSTDLAQNLGGKTQQESWRKSWRASVKWKSWWEIPPGILTEILARNHCGNLNGNPGRGFSENFSGKFWPESWRKSWSVSCWKSRPHRYFQMLLTANFPLPIATSNLFPCPYLPTLRFLYIYGHCSFPPWLIL